MSGHCRRVRVPPHGSANGAGASPHRRSYNSVGGHGADRDPLGGLVHSTREGSGRVFRFVSHLVQTVCELESSRVKLSRRLSVEEYGIMRCDTYSLCTLEIVLVCCCCCCCCCLIGLRDPAVKIKSRNLFTDGPMGQIDREVVTREARVPSEVLLRTSIKSLNPSPYCDVISSPNLWSVLIGLSCIETDARHAGRHLPARIDSCQHFITNFVHIK